MINYCMVEYKKNKDVFECYFQGELRFETKDPYFLFDVHSKSKTIILLKHGAEETVNEVFQTYKQIPNSFNLFSVFMVSVKKIPVEELNKIINCTGYIPKDLKEFLYDAQSLDSHVESL